MIQKLKNISQTFASNSTIHSVSFIADGNRNKSTRIFWSIALSFSVAFFGFYAYGAYNKWRINPDFLTRTHQRHVSEIPFPAITICSNLFARDQLANSKEFHRKYYVTMKFAENMTVKEANYLMACLQAAGNPQMTMKGSKLVPNRTETNIVKLLNESFLNTNEFLFGCSYKRLKINCDYVFNRVLTDRGFCYSSNMEGFNTIFRNSTISKDFHSYKRKTRKSPVQSHPLYRKKMNDDVVNTKWTLDQGFASDHDPDEVPIVPNVATDYRAVMFLNKSDASNLKYGSYDSFPYQLHIPTDMMTPLSQWEFLKFYSRFTHFLSAKIYKTNEDLRTFSPDIRGCYFDDERYLRYFKSYSKNNCDCECLSNYTLDLCKCVKFSMPRDDKTPVCNESQTECYNDFVKVFPKYDPVTKKMDSCNCLKSCTEIKYQIVDTQISNMDSEVLFSYAIKNSSEGDIFSAINVRFETHLIEEQEMYAAYTLQNFIADTGGLLGLFMGCSLLSIIELVFFFSQIVIQTMFYLWIKFCNRNIVQNIISVKPITAIDNHQKANDENLNKLDQKQDKMPLYKDDLRQLEQKLDKKLQDQQENLEQMKKDISAIKNQVKGLIQIKRF